MAIKPQMVNSVLVPPYPRHLYQPVAADAGEYVRKALAGGRVRQLGVEVEQGAKDEGAVRQPGVRHLSQNGQSQPTFTKFSILRFSHTNLVF